MKNIALIILLSASFLTACGGSSSPSQPANAPVSASTLLIDDVDGKSKNLTEGVSLASSCAESTEDYRVISGTLISQANECNTLILTTNAAPGSYSEGVIEFSQDITSPLLISANMERLTSDTSRPLEIKALGAYIGTTPFNGTIWYYIYESEAHWTGWIDTGIPTENSISIVARQDGKRISTWLNAYRVEDFMMTNLSNESRVWLKLKGDPSFASRTKIRNFTVAKETAHDAQALAPQTSQLPDLSRAKSIDFGQLPDNTGMPWIHKLTLTNASSAPVSAPQAVVGLDTVSQLVNTLHPRSCDNITNLLPGKSCVISILDPTDFSQIASASTGKSTKFGGNSITAAATKTGISSVRTAIVRSGSTYTPIQVTTAIATPARPAGYVVGISPIVARKGVRQAFTVYGFGLPTTIALDLSGQTCLNNNKLSAYTIECDIGFNSSVAVTVRDTISGRPYSIPTVFSRVFMLPLSYVWPLDSTYKTVCWDVGDVNKNRTKPYHTGLDMYSAVGAKVYAITDGVVVRNNTSTATVDNKFLLIDHGGLFAYYGHINSGLTAGSKVNSGNPIGSVVEYSPKKETHLHFSLSNSFVFDPMRYGNPGWGYRDSPASVQADFEPVRPYFGNPALTKICY